MSTGAFLFSRRVTAFAGMCAVIVSGFCFPQFVAAQPSPAVRITVLHYYGRESTADEAIRLTNTSAETITLDSAWSLAASYGTGARTALAWQLPQLAANSAAPALMSAAVPTCAGGSGSGPGGGSGWGLGVAPPPSLKARMRLALPLV